MYLLVFTLQTLTVGGYYLYITTFCHVI